MTDIERRFVSLETTITGRKLGGYAAVFDQRTDMGPYLESLAPTAFRAALASPNLDVRGLFNHNPDKLLARTTNGSLRLSTDSHGLEFELDLNDELPAAAEARANVNAGLVTGCSFGFVAGEQHWDAYEGRDVRVHTSVAELRDVSVVTYPAYQGTTVSLRSKPITEPANGRSQLILARARVHLPKGN
ncbi:HK97 family phage prohead protease [Mycolicibacterium fluoranthenivorans]|uniref:Prohead serine protease domain-containing protein n=1 Tax=Mycolicibacterium fluoranthenivorans TaxID=258505 RepID=A0A7X5TZQ8_9MYCO|nr:HK97 family phage prohead protease [Mycolicibacterium fluoranthenivorans]MCV7358159.1 HK97 family phage prohead protease [Mycolicibacterium fluoranthenivorans]NIH95719.1 hypothetical protein [Mycolicibacterium fluoranthenivorans]